MPHISNPSYEELVKYYLTEGGVPGCSYEEVVVLVEAGRTVEEEAEPEEVRPTDEPKTIVGDFDEHRRRTKHCNCCRTAPSNPLAKVCDQD